MEKKNNKGIVVALVIAIFIILGLGGYIVYDKVLNKEDIQNNNDKKEEELNNLNYSQINETLERYIFDYVAKCDDMPDFENNVESRLEFTTWVFFRDGDILESGDDYTFGQDFVYVSKKDFEAKYNKIFGDQYNCIEDLAIEEKRCSTDSEAERVCVNAGYSIPEINDYLKSDDYISWFTTYGTGWPQYTINATKVVKSENDYIISGNYELYNPDETEKLEEGTFSVVYAKKGNDPYLKSVSLNE